MFSRMLAALAVVLVVGLTLVGGCRKGQTAVRAKPAAVARPSQESYATAIPETLRQRYVAELARSAPPAQAAVIADRQVSRQLAQPGSSSTGSAAAEVLVASEMTPDRPTEAFMIASVSRTRPVGRTIRTSWVPSEPRRATPLVVPEAGPELEGAASGMLKPGQVVPKPKAEVAVPVESARRTVAVAERVPLSWVERNWVDPMPMQY